jgi:hypothetical protein
MVANRARTDPILVVLLGASLVLNGFLAFQLHGFRKGVGLGSAVPVGTEVGLLQVKDSGGQPARLDFNGSQTVLYVFSPACHWCDRNQKNVQALARDRRASYRFVGLSLQALLPGSKSADIGFPVFTEPSKETTAQLKLGATPTTVVISKDGRVERVWVGAYEGAVGKEVAEFFKVQLPGLTGVEGSGDTPKDDVAYGDRVLPDGRPSVRVD